MQWKSCRGKFTRKFLRRRIDAASDIEQGCRTLRNSGAGFVCGGGNCVEIWRGSDFFVRASEGFDRRADRAQQQHFQRIRHDYSRNSFAADCAGNFCRRVTFGGGDKLSGCAAESSRRSLCSRRIVRRGSGIGIGFDH